MWWINKKDVLLDIASKTSNCIVYNKKSIEKSITKLNEIESIDRLFYAMKANFNPEILQIINEYGLGFECVSTGEIKHLYESVPNINDKKIIYTPNFAARDDYIWALNNQIMVTVDNLYPFIKWPEIFKNKRIMIRVDPGVGDGHHDHVITGGSFSKFGIPMSDVEKIIELSKKYNINII